MRCALGTCGGGEDALQGRGAEHQEHQVRDWPHPPLGAQAAGPAPGRTLQALPCLRSELREASQESIFCKNFRGKHAPN